MSDARLLGAEKFGIADSAVAAYAAREGLTPDQARTELYDVLAQAKQSQTNPNGWRYRSRSDGLDLSVITVYDEARRHLVVVKINAREVSRTGRRERDRHQGGTSGSAVPPPEPAPRMVQVTFSASEYGEIVHELRGEESPADLLRASALATARARARARGVGR